MFIFNRRLKLRCQHGLVCCRNVATQGYTSYVHPSTRRLKFNLSFNKDFPISYQHKLTIFSWPSRTFPDPITMSLILSTLPPTLTNTQVLTHRLFLTTNCFFFAAPYLGKHVLNWSPRLLFCHVFKTPATLFFKRLCILWNRKCLHDQMKKSQKSVDSFTMDLPDFSETLVMKNITSLLSCSTHLPAVRCCLRQRTQYCN